MSEHKASVLHRDAIVYALINAYIVLAVSCLIGRLQYSTQQRRRKSRCQQDFCVCEVVDLHSQLSTKFKTL